MAPRTPKDYVARAACRVFAASALGLATACGSGGGGQFDGGADRIASPDGHPDSPGKEAGQLLGKDTAPPCPAPSGGNDLSFVLECTGGPCDVKAQLDFHLDTTNAAYPGCADRQNSLELVDLKTSGPLLGNDASHLEMDITSYGGPGAYKLESSTGNTDLLFNLSANPACEGEGGGPSDLPPLIIQNVSLASEGGLPDAGLSPPPSCDVKVATDCLNEDGTHNVAGTLSCSFDHVGAGWSCTLSQGKFQFGHCAP